LSIGYPTSPVLSNFVFQSIDRQIEETVARLAISYTRYADDCFFPSDLPIISTQIDVFSKIIEDVEFKINYKKILILKSVDSKFLMNLNLSSKNYI
jgi:RNA-directed DNA polymerase